MYIIERIHPQKSNDNNTMYDEIIIKLLLITLILIIWKIDLRNKNSLLWPCDR